MEHVILHTLEETLILLPFLFVCYILIELVESWTSKKTTKGLKKHGIEVLVGAGVGLIPQCGFGVVATDLYTRKKLSMGTLLAIYIATSDEAVPLLLANPQKAPALLPLLVLKFLFALAVGYLVFAIETKLTKKHSSPIVSNHNHDHEHDEEHSHDHEEEERTHIGCCGHAIEETQDNSSTTKQRLKRYLLHPLRHTLYIFAFILIVTFAFNTLVHFVGEDNISTFLNSAKVFTPILAVLVGLIPNCASSVVLTNMYILGSLPFGALLAGLIANAGISITVLFKQNRPLKNTFLILGILILTALVAGYSVLYLI